MLRCLDLDGLHQDFDNGEPFRHVVLDELLEPDFARHVASSFPSFQESLEIGHRFESVNEHRKVQVTERDRFPEPVRKLNEMLSSPGFLDKLSRMTGIPNLQADHELNGGGIHETATGGRLDVHIDFSYVPHLRYFRRLNLLLYMNPEWHESWGGHIELWDKAVTTCQRAELPTLNKCLIFETNQTSYHGVRRVTSPGVSRKSFSAYYYTYDPPPGFNDDFHGTVFRARPRERTKKYFLMPAEAMMRRAAYRWRQLTGRVVPIPGTEQERSA